MFDKYEKKIREQAAKAYPEEGVWLITKKGCRQVKNVHADPLNHFKVGIADLAKANSQGLLAVVHSHPDRPNVPSAADMRGQINCAVPWGILTSSADGCTSIRWWGGEPAPLIGRPFVHGVTDCYALIKDYYKVERGVDIPEFPRDWNWWNEGEDLFMQGFESAGFRKISQLEAQAGDVWLARMRSPVVNHGGILLDGALMLHQIGNPNKPVDESRLSAREPMSRYLDHVHIWLRYAG